MENPAVVGAVRESPDLRGVVRRTHVVIHSVLALGLISAVGLPMAPRLAVAAVSVLALGVPRIGASLPLLGRSEWVAASNVLAGFVAFLVMPEVPALSFGLTLIGLIAAALVARPMIERLVLAVVVVLELVKLPIVAGSDFTSSIPLLSDVMPRPLDIMAASFLQSTVMIALYGVVHAAAGVLRRTQRALVESEARYRRLTEGLPNAVVVVSENKVVFANNAAQALLGDIAIVVEGHHLAEVLPDEVIPGLKDAIREVRESGEALEIEGRPYGDGSTAVHLNAALSALDFEGKAAVMIVISDVSARFAAEQVRRQGEARFRSAFLNTATPFVLLTPKATVLDLNDAAIRLFSYSRDAAIGKRWEGFVERGDVAQFKEFAGAASVGILNHLRTEVVLIPRSGNAVRAEVDVSVDRDPEGELRSYIIQIHDVTARHEAEQALRMNEERYRSLFERSPVALYRTKPDGEIVDVNAALLDLMGYRSKEDLLSQEAERMYVDPAERASMRDQLLDDGEMRGRESQVVRADGTVIWVRDTARVYATDDEVIFEGSLVEITERRRADAALRRAAVQGETVAKLGQLALASPNVDELFAKTAHSVGSVLDISTVGIVLPTASGRFEQAAAVDWPGESETQLEDRVDALIGYAAGASRPVVVDASPAGEDGVDPSAVGVAIRGAEGLLGVLVAMDRGGRPFSPDGLHFLRSVANVLAAAIDRHESRTQLERLVQSKDEFIASISHELRTPLTVVAGMAHELQDQWGQFTEEEIFELVSLMVDQSGDMQNLIEDLLVAARADIGRVPVHVVAIDLSVAIESVLAALPERNGAVVRSDLAPVVAMADPTRVRQIVRNLVTNALRYGGNTITVTTGSHGETTFVQVYDDGPGIPEEKRDQIFEPYESAHEAVGMPGSVGLGLTISRKLARLLGGDLSYRSEGGSLFELTLPAADHVAVGASRESETPLSWSSLLS